MIWKVAPERLDRAVAAVITRRRTRLELPRASRQQNPQSEINPYAHACLRRARLAARGSGRQGAFFSFEPPSRFFTVGRTTEQRFLCVAVEARGSPCSSTRSSLPRRSPPSAPLGRRRWTAKLDEAIWQGPSCDHTAAPAHAKRRDARKRGDLGLGGRDRDHLYVAFTLSNASSLLPRAGFRQRRRHALHPDRPMARPPQRLRVHGQRQRRAQRSARNRQRAVPKTRLGMVSGGLRRGEPRTAGRASCGSPSRR